MTDLCMGHAVNNATEHCTRILRVIVGGRIDQIKKR